MEPCLVCGEFYDPMVEPDHEELCGEELIQEFNIDYKPNEDLMRILEEQLLDEKAKKELEH